MNEKSSEFPTGESIRAALIGRVDAYCRMTGASRSSLGKTIKNDTSLFADIEEGRNFTMSLYDAVMEWLDKHWPAETTGDGKA